MTGESQFLSIIYNLIGVGMVALKLVGACVEGPPFVDATIGSRRLLILNIEARDLMQNIEPSLRGRVLGEADTHSNYYATAWVGCRVLVSMRSCHTHSG